LLSIKPQIIMQNYTSFQEKLKPQIRIVQTGDQFKVIFVRLQKGAVLEKHTTSERTKIFVVKGTVEYRSLREVKHINQMEEYIIPLNEIHEVTANGTAEFLLIQG